MSCNRSLANMFKQSNFQVFTDWSRMGPKGSQGSQPKWERRHLSERHPWLQGTAPRRGQDFQSRGHIGLEGRWTLPVQGAPRHKKTPSNRVVTCLYMVSIGVHWCPLHVFPKFLICKTWQIYISIYGHHVGHSRVFTCLYSENPKKFNQWNWRPAPPISWCCLGWWRSPTCGTVGH